ncbi:putative short-chain dehydrogenase/reductase family 42E member 2 [Arapaima gigas]
MVEQLTNVTTGSQRRAVRVPPGKVNIFNSFTWTDSLGVRSMHDSSAACQLDEPTSLCLPGQNVSLTQRRTNGHGLWANGIGNTANSTAANRCQNRDCTVSPLHDLSVDRGKVGKVLVTGGAGYLGHRLGKALADAGVSVILLDIVKPRWDTPDGAVFHQNDIRDYNSLYSVCKGVDCIYHTASYGMSGPEQLNKGQVESVNVGGTNNVINVCLERRVSRLVYTSTVNVSFVGLPIEDGDEDSAPRVPFELHVDHYSRTKAIAEQMVLEANGRPLKGGGILHTCVLRPSGIYGPEERRHLHRVNIERRFFSFSFGNREARMNWVHVDNLVMAHVLAAEGLTLSKDYVASGQAYFINDGESVNLFEWLTPLVWNIAVTHTFKIQKAHRELGFSPRRYSLADSVDQYLRTRSVRPTKPLLTVYRILLLVLLAMASLLYFCW